MNNEAFDSFFSMTHSLGRLFFVWLQPSKLVLAKIAKGLRSVKVLSSTASENILKSQFRKN